MIRVRKPSLPQVIASHAKWRPNAPAIVSGDTVTTYVELQARVDRLAGGLAAAGLMPGDRACALLDNSVELVEVILGTIQAGGAIALLSPLASGPALESMLATANPRAVFADTALLNGAEVDAEHRIRVGASDQPDGWQAYEQWIAAAPGRPPLQSYDLEAPISILFTSGTTGNPKGMVHSHRARLGYPLGLGSVLGISHTSRSVVVTPMYHNGTWTTMLPTLYAGGTLVVAPKFSGLEFLELVERQRCTHAFMVPTQLQMLLSDPQFDGERLRSMEVIMCSGQPLSPDTLVAIEQQLSFVRFCEIYGMGEGFMTYADAHDYALGKRGTVGLPIAILDTDVQIIDEQGHTVERGEVGEIVGTSCLMMDGYLGDPDRTESAVWRSPCGREYIRSGDLGRLDEDGYLHIVGRLKDVIISGGVKVNATEIENVFLRHPAVAEAVAIGVPHEKWGETPLVLAIPSGDLSISEDDLRAWANAQLGKTERVSGVEFRSEFPRNALQKVLRRELRAVYWAGRDRDI